MKIFSREFLFAFFIISGTLKGLFTFLPIDLTLLAMIISFISVFVPIIVNKRIPKNSIKPSVIYIILGAFVLFSTLYSPIQSDSILKSVQFLTVTAWSFIGVFFVIRNKDSLKRFFVSILILSYIMAFAALFQFFQTQGGFINVLGANYIALGRTSAFGVLILICLYLYKMKVSWYGKLLIYSSIILLSLSVLVSGGRMPVISLVIAIVSIFILTIRINQGKIYIRKGTKRLVIVFILGLISLIPFYKQGVFDTFIYRFQFLMKDGGGASVENRFDRFDIAMKMFYENPFFGTGIGSFSHYDTGAGVSEYPHNIFLEFLSETGLIGLILFLILLAFSLTRFYYANKKENTTNKYFLLIFSFFVYLFTTVNVSGDINENRIFFTSLALLCISSLMTNNKESTIIENVEGTDNLKNHRR